MSKRESLPTVPVELASQLPELATASTYEEFCDVVWTALMHEWLDGIGHAVEYDNAKDEITLAWLGGQIAAGHTGTILRADAQPAEVSKCAILLESMFGATAQNRLNIDNRRAKDFNRNLDLSLASTKRLQTQFEPFLHSHGYKPGSKTAIRAYETLTGVIQDGWRLSLGTAELPPQYIDIVTNRVNGMTREYRAVKALRQIGYDEASLTDVETDKLGYDVGIPCIDPKYFMEKVFYIQLKPEASHSLVRQEMSRRDRELVLRIPNPANDDYFQIDKPNMAKLKEIMDIVLPLDMTFPGFERRQTRLRSELGYEVPL